MAFLLFWFVYPYLWMLCSTSKANQEIYDPTKLFPDAFSFESFRVLFTGQYVPFFKSFTSSVIIAVGQSFGAVYITALSGYYIARKRFRGRALIFLISVAVIVLPRQVISIPIFQWLEYLSLRGGYLAVILPGMVSGLGLLFFVQIFKKIPSEYIDASRVEGATEIRTFMTVCSMVVPALLTYGILHFVLAWHEHLLPLLLLDDEKRTLPLALTMLNDPSHRVPQSVVMAASMFTLLPVLVLFGLMFRQFKSAMSDVLVH